MKKIYFIAFAVIISTAIFAQDYNMSSTTISTCSGVFFDSGGTAGNYSSSQDLSMTFTSDNGNRISFDFQSFSTESGFDYLYIYDGDTEFHPLIGYYTATNSPGIVESTGESLTFVFHSDGSGTDTGWEADISCTTTPLTTYYMWDGIINTCGGIFYDEGGPGTNYSDNLDITETFCSDAGNYIAFDFSNYNYNISPLDTLFVYDGSTTSDQLIGIYTGSQLPEIISSKTGSCLTFRFISDNTTNNKGWQAFISCQETPENPDFTMSDGVRYTCGGRFFDSGGSDGNYSSNQDRTMTFISDDGNRLSFDFTAFYIESGSDYLYIYDGTSIYHPIIGYYTGSTSSIPDIVTSSGTSLTFRFHSDGSTTYSGWEADISCAGAPLTPYVLSSPWTVNTCEGVFYDPGYASANYYDNDDETMTFCSDADNFIAFDFTKYNYNINISDTLFVYDGGAITDPLIGAYTGSQLPEIISSKTGNCLTFRFISDNATNQIGWQAFISCQEAPEIPDYTMSDGIRYTCGGKFYDSGGSQYNYSSNQDRTMTFFSDNGNRISFDFTEYYTESAYDYLYIYDGPTTDYPLITYLNGSSVAPYNVISTGTSLTFAFSSDGSNTYSGWEADISCTTAPLTTYDMSSGTISVCEGVFYDNGGANANYSDNEDETVTFCSASGNFITIDFTNHNFNIEPGDSLFVYDGSDIYASPIAILSGYYSPIQISSITGSCLTFRFVSNNDAGTSDGWQGIISCSDTPPNNPAFNMSNNIWYTCEATFFDSHGASGNYYYNENRQMTFCSNSGCPISVDFIAFSTEGGFDYLSIYDGMNTSATLIGAYSGSTSPGVIVSTNSCLTFQFESDGSNVYSGWEAELSCSKASITVDPSEVLCETESLTLTANMGLFYHWNTDEITPSINPTTTGIYSVIVTDGDGCHLVSDPVSITFNPNPATPTITETDNILYSSVTGENYEWFDIGDILVFTSTTSSSFSPTINGTYYVVVTDVNGCSSVSDEYVFVLTENISLSINDISIFPNPTTGIFTIEGQDIQEIKVFDITGKLIFAEENLEQESATINLQNQAKGVYFVKIYCDKSVITKKLIIQQ